MRDLKPYAVFAEVVAAGSMSAAARRLGLTPSAISQVVSALERQAGVSLLHRSTRKLTLTEAGERCYPHCVELLQAANAAAASLERARDAPAGELRIAAPLGFGEHVAPAFAPVLAEWPRLRLSLIVDDAMINLIDARIDIALRVGELPDSRWIGRKLCDMATTLCASPAYLQRHGVPDQPSDLTRHHWLALMHEVRSGSNEAISDQGALPSLPLELASALGGREIVMLAVRTTTTNQIALRQMCEQGMGIAHLFDMDIQPALERGSLIRVLPKNRLPSPTLTLLTAERDNGPAKVTVAVAALRSYFASVRQPR